MSKESKGRAWYDKIYRKLVVEVDSFASQGKVSLESSDSAGLISVKDESEKLTEGDGLKEKLSDSVWIDEKLEEHFIQIKDEPEKLMEEQMEGDGLKEKLSHSVRIDEKLEEHCVQIKDEPEKLTEEQMEGDSLKEKFSDSVRIDEKLEEHCVQIKDEPDGEKLEEHCVQIKDEPEILTEGNGLKEKLSDSVRIDEKLEEHCVQIASESLCHNDPISSPASQATHPSLESLKTVTTTCNDDTVVFTSGISTGDSNLIPCATETQAAPVENIVAKTESFSKNSMKGIEDVDTGPLDTSDLYDMTSREGPSDFDDNLLYAVRERIKQQRSFKRKMLDALTAKKRREKEYEQLAIWFGDADMGCDFANTKKPATISLDSKSSQSNVPFVSDDSEWELL